MVYIEAGRIANCFVVVDRDPAARNNAATFTGLDLEP
jgi:hypothetical protein